LSDGLDGRREGQGVWCAGCIAWGLQVWYRSILFMRELSCG
jgi:hypothetical protein